MATRKILAADLFCGAGGTSTGLARACEQLGSRPQLIAVNHWNVAVETHAANHPWAQHFCASLDSIDPAKAVPGGRLNLLVASPECTHHSLARGGRPCSDQSRASAWLILKWLQELYVENVLIENVQEFTSWGPLGADGRPLKSKRGQTFSAFIQALRSLGYVVDWRVLNAADYGDATTRERLFIIARRGRRKIAWPEASHTRTPDQAEMFDAKRPWRPAREIIDWTIPSQSIFTRKRPLAPATIERIAAGLRKFGGKWAEPFLVILRRHADARSLDQPVPALTAGGEHIGLCQPFVFSMEHTPRAFVMPVAHGGREMRTHDIERPMPTITTVDAWGLVEPFLVPFFGERDGQQPRTHSVGDPLPTVTSHGAGALIEPLVVQYNGTADARPVSEPLGAITTRDRFGLVTCDGYALDIHFRMLHWRELAAAHTFPAGYKFSGTREQIVKQIGNSVPTEEAAALCRELIAA